MFCNSSLSSFRLFLKAYVTAFGIAVLTLIPEPSNAQLPDKDAQEIKKLIKELADPEFDVRAQACAALVSRAKLAIPYISDLIIAFSDPQLGVRSSLAGAFGQMGPAAKPAIPALLHALKVDQNMQVRRSVVNALGLIKSDPKNVVPLLIEVLGDPDDPMDEDIVSLPQAACFALGNFGKDAKAAVPGLLDMLRKRPKDIPLRFAIVGALGNVGGDDPKAVAVVVEFLDAKYETLFRGRAAHALGRMGPNGKAGIQSLVAIARMEKDDDKSHSAKLSAVWALGQMAEALTAQGKNALIETLRNKKLPADLRQYASTAAKTLGPKNFKESIPALIEVVKENTVVHTDEALIAMGKDSVPFLIPLVKSGPTEVRANALRIIEGIGPDAIDAQTAVRAALEDRRVRFYAEKALKSILAKNLPPAK